MVNFCRIWAALDTASSWSWIPEAKGPACSLQGWERAVLFSKAIDDLSESRGFDWLTQDLPGNGIPSMQNEQVYPFLPFFIRCSSPSSFWFAGNSSGFHTSQSSSSSMGAEKRTHPLCRLCANMFSAAWVRQVALTGSRKNEKNDYRSLKHSWLLVVCLVQLFMLLLHCIRLRYTQLD